jgi:hypothetical protein
MWVIQELILSPRAVIRVGDIEFFADPTLSTDLQALPSGWHWDSTAAPWVQYTGWRKFPAKDIYEVMRLTSNSRASDPRDRLFGLVGLIQNGAREPLQPNYFLSAQHVFVGIFAHCIINERALHLFFSSAGLSAPATSPSWIPDWATHESWEHIFMEPNSNSEDVARYIRREILKIPSNDVARMLRLIVLSKPPDDRSPFILHRLELGSAMSNTSQRTAETVFQRRPWNRDILVDIDTGALSIYLTRFCTISSPPVLVGRLGALGIFEVRGSESCLYLATQHPLEAAIRPTYDDLFILNPGDSALIYLILRELDSPKTYKVVASCPHLFISFRLRSNRANTTGSLSIERLQRSLYSEVEQARRMLESDLCNHWHEAQFFPGARKRWDLFPIYRSILNERDRCGPGFYTSCLSCVDTRFRPHIADGFVEFSFDRFDWYQMHNYYMFLPKIEYKVGERLHVLENPWDWRTEGGKWKSFLKRPVSLSSVLGRSVWGRVPPRVYVRAPKTRVAEEVWLHSRFITEIMERIRRVLKCGLDEVEVLLRSGPEDEHHFVGCPDGFDKMEKDFDVDGSTYQVRIL